MMGTLSRILAAAQVVSVVIIGACVAQEGTLVWKINTDPPSFISGVMDLPYQMFQGLIHNNAIEAFVYANQTYFSEDPSRDRSAIPNCQLMGDDKTLHDILSPEVFYGVQSAVDDLYQRLLEANLTRGAFREKRTILQNWQKYKPQWFLKHFFDDLLELVFRGQPLEDGIYDEARTMGKRFGALEDVDLLCRLFDEIDSDELVFALEMLIQLPEVANYVFSARSSDFSSTERCTHPRRSLQINCHSPPEVIARVLPLVRSYLNIFQERNVMLAHRVASLIQGRATSYFFFIKIEHLLLGTTVIDELLRAGIDVTPLRPDDNLRLLENFTVEQYNHYLHLLHIVSKPMVLN